MSWTFKLNLDLTSSWQNEPWYTDNEKNSAYGRHQIYWPMLIEVPIPKSNFFWGGGDVRTDIQRYGQTDGHTDGRRRGGFTFHMSTYHLWHVSAVQWNATLQYSAVQHCSRLVNQKIQGSYLKKKLSYRAEFLQEALEIKELHRKKFVIFLCKFWPFYGDFSV